MDHIAHVETVSTQGWDALVQGAITTSGVDGVFILDGGRQPQAVPHGLQALMSALLHFLAPEAPRRMRVYTYDMLNVGALMEVRGARLLSGLPDQLVDLGKQLGVRIHFHQHAGSSSVLVTLPVVAG